MAELATTLLRNDANLKAYYRLEGNANDEKGSFHGTATDITYIAGKFWQGGLWNGTTFRIVLATDIVTAYPSDNYLGYIISQNL